MRSLRRPRAPALALLALACGTIAGASEPLALDARTASVVLVRHAERESGDDPDLTAVGAERARSLAALLAPAGIAEVHATSAKRSRQTAAPTAAAAGVPVAIYSDESALVAALRLAPAGEHHLVVAHSDTIGAIARGLGAEWRDADPLEEFDRLFVVERRGSQVSLRRFRYTPDPEDGMTELP
jgi:broad specificity phosphatase PhoE